MEIKQSDILARALKNAVRDLVGDYDDAVVKNYLYNAECEITREGYLTKNQKWQLKLYINDLAELTHHDYVAIKYCKTPVRHMRFYHKSAGYDKPYDIICPSPIPFADNVFEFNREYDLLKILED